MLLRVLENGEMQPVGSDRPNRVDVRIIAATNRDLGELVTARAFREDLLYRLRVIHLHIPPLRERPEDVPPLVAHVLAHTGRRKTVSDAAMQVLIAHRWPGNVRELRNVIEQAVTLSVRDVIWPDDLPVQVRGGGPRPGQASERRRQVADELFEALVAGNCAFWAHVHPLFLSRDLTRHDVRELVRRGLARTRGNYRALLRLFGMSGNDYKKFLNFLAAHDCSVDFRPFRSGEGVSPAAVRPPRVSLPESPMPAPPAARQPGRP